MATNLFPNSDPNESNDPQENQPDPSNQTPTETNNTNSTSNISPQPLIMGYLNSPAQIVITHVASLPGDLGISESTYKKYNLLALRLL